MPLQSGRPSTFKKARKLSGELSRKETLKEGNSQGRKRSEKFSKTLGLSRTYESLKRKKFQ
jgi:hypothetical protein